MPFFFLVDISTPTPPTTSRAPIALNSRVPKPPVVGSVKPLRLITVVVSNLLSLQPVPVKVVVFSLCL